MGLHRAGHLSLSAHHLAADLKRVGLTTKGEKKILHNLVTFKICLKAHETRRPGRQKTRHVPLSSWSASVGDVISLDLGRLFECF